MTSQFTNPALKRIFDLNELPVVTLEIQENDWNSLLMAFDEDPSRNFWIPGNFVFAESLKIPTQVVNNVGLRVRGNTSRSRPEGNPGELHNPNRPIWRQVSFAIQFARFTSTQRFEGLSRIDLKFIREDPTRIREVFSFDLLQQAGIISGPLISFCRFYIKIANDRPAYFGLYRLKEFIDEDYLENRKEFFGNSGTQRPFLWKGNNGAALNDYNPSVIENRDIYDLRTNTSFRQEANIQLAQFVRNLVNLQDEALSNWATQNINVPILMRTYMANVLCGNMDDYWFNSNDYNFYFNTQGIFYFIPNDFDTTLGTGWGIDAGRQDIMNWGNPANPLIAKLINQVPHFRQLYIDAFKELTDKSSGPFYVDKSIRRIGVWHKLIEKFIPDETIHNGCQNQGSYCVVGIQGNNSQTAFEDQTAWWSMYSNRKYRLLERGFNNFFEVSGKPSRINQLYFEYLRSLKRLID